jgi:gamma-glutamylcyclotransferase (GGCT)/AIG2-like uncharacterized protein YtfP
LGDNDHLIVIWQYGPNMDEDRLNSSKRLNGKAKYIQAAIKKGYELSFTHTNDDGVGTADIVAKPTGYVIGCLYEIPEEMLEKLDQVEGVNYGAYKRAKMNVTRIDGALPKSSEPICAITYVVVNKEKNPPKTNTEYANHLLRGIVTHKMGKAYYEKIKRIITENNPSIEEDLIKYIS